VAKAPYTPKPEPVSDESRQFWQVSPESRLTPALTTATFRVLVNRWRNNGTRVFNQFAQTKRGGQGHEHDEGGTATGSKENSRRRELTQRDRLGEWRSAVGRWDQGYSKALNKQVILLVLSLCFCPRPEQN
jgi:hypothetical protein